MEQHSCIGNNSTSSFHRSSSSNSESKGQLHSHNRNVSLDSSLSRIKGLNINALPLNNENSPNVSSISPGAHSLIGATDEAVNIASVLISSPGASKGGPGSRGSSPASKKKLNSELSGTGSSGRRRSPLVSRKAPIGSESSFTTPPSSRARFSSSHEEDQLSMDDRDLEGRASASVFNGSSDAQTGPDFSSAPKRSGTEGDEADGGPSLLYTPPSQQPKAQEVIEQLQAKIQKTAKLIKDEQMARDDNVNEYLQLSANADRQQLLRIKTVFEKKNQKSAANIQHLQKKLEKHRRNKREVEQHGIPSTHRQPKEVLRDVGYGIRSVGDNIRDGISGFSGKKGLIGKQKEIAHLIKNKFGSADNIKELGEEEKDEQRNHHGSATLPPNSGLHPTTSSIALASKTPAGSGTMGSSGGGGSGGGGGGGGSSGGGKIGSEEGSECNSSMTSESASGGVTAPYVPFASPQNHHGMTSFEAPMSTPFMESVLQELKERQEESARLREEIEVIKQTLTTEVSHLCDTLMEEKIRYERLEEQVNDLTELHQNEMENLKTAMKDLSNMEEKVQYKNEESIRDLNEMVDSCQAKISRMEHQQAQQQQQFLTLEGLENTNARILFVKLINVLLMVLQVLLLVVATIAGILTPLLQTKTRLVSTATLCLFVLFAYLQLSEIRGAWQNLLSRVGHQLS